MSDYNEKEIESLEDEIQELLIKENKEAKHRRYLNIGAIIGIIFVFISTGNEDEFYSFFGTFGMGIINGVTGLCVLMAVIFLLPGVRDEERYKWERIEEKRKKIEELKKDIK